ncbi:MAG TPA: ATP-dependent helicase [Candidatus Binatia bacterium]|nr:ATP-dependent helicase [Candidatus Binatia bacterium]
MATYTIRRAAAESRSFRIDYAAELNAAQLEAVTTLDGPVLVVAGAGSGKTRTLTYRVARLVETGVPARAIVLLTFTRRAAQEMLRRASALLGGGADDVVGGTFHSFANVMLRRWARAFGWPESFTILDRSDSEDAIQLARVRLGLDRRDRRFPRKQTLGDIYSTAVNKGIGIGDVVEREYVHLLDDLEDIVRCHELYVAYKRERGLLDYDDLLLELRDRLRDRAEFAERLQQTYRYLMVDEYQDTNHLQADITALLAGKRANVMAVGDDAQSIYGFRGADFKNIMSFPDRFPGTRLIALEENYRSTQPILDVTNAIIAQARERYSKTLYTRRGGGVRPQLVPSPDDRLQSLFVTQRILELAEEGVPLTEIAVLFRSSFHSFDLELELARAGIPFVKRGGFRFIETAHVKDVLAHLRVVDNPRDAVSWHRILLLLEGVGPRAAAAVVDWLGSPEGSLAGLAELAGLPGVRGQALAGVRQLGALLARLDPARERPPALVQAVLAHYRPVLERVHHDDAPKRLRDLEQFGVLAERYRSLTRFLADMALEPPSDSVGDVMAVDAPEGEVLTLSTIHSAKGLEWHSVFVISVADGRFPSTYSMDEDEIEEERRLLYVACTRARENLILTYPATMYDRGLGVVPARPSRFLDAVGPALLEPVTLLEEE